MRGLLGYQMESSINSAALALAIRAAWSAASKDLYRAHLSCVQVVASGGKVSVNATDGHRLHRVTFAGIGEFAHLFLIPKKVSKTAIATIEGCALVLSDGPSVTRFDARFDGVQYPDVLAVLPKPVSRAYAGPIGLNAGYVADACASGAMVASKKTGQVAVTIGTDSLSPVNVDAQSVEFSELDLRFTAVVMPIRI